MRFPALILLPVIAMTGLLSGKGPGLTPAAAWGWARTVPGKMVAGTRTAVTARELRLHWAATSLVTLASFSVDRQLQERALAEGLMPEAAARLGDAWGGKWAAIGILPGILLVDKLNKATREEALSRLDFAFTSLLTVGTTTYILKYAIGRERPNGADRLSFPSGHTSITFGVAEVLRTLYGNRAGTAFYTLAAVTAISRIHDNKHYLSDVVAAAGLGVGLVRGFALAMGPGRLPATRLEWHITPAGFQLSCRLSR